MPALTPDQINQILDLVATYEQGAPNVTPSAAWTAAVGAASIEAFGGEDSYDAFAIVFGFQQEYIAAQALGMTLPTPDPFTARVYELYQNPDS